MHYEKIKVKQKNFRSDQRSQVGFVEMWEGYTADDISYMLWGIYDFAYDILEYISNIDVDVD